MTRLEAFAMDVTRKVFAKVLFDDADEYHRAKRDAHAVLEREVRKLADEYEGHALLDTALPDWLDEPEPQS